MKWLWLSEWAEFAFEYFNTNTLLPAAHELLNSRNTKWNQTFLFVQPSVWCSSCCAAERWSLNNTAMNHVCGVKRPSWDRSEVDFCPHGDTGQIWPIWCPHDFTEQRLCLWSPRLQLKLKQLLNHFFSLITTAMVAAPHILNWRLLSLL